MTDLTQTCPECSTPARPYDTELDPGGLLALYECPECGTTWELGWRLDETELDQRWAERQEMAKAA
jgi:hypothetical protein